MMTAKEILAIDKSEPERLFSRAGLDAEHRDLLKIWHPDRHPEDTDRATKVSAHIGMLYREAKIKRDAGIWSKPGMFEFDATNGKRFEFKVLAKSAFDLGRILYNDTRVAFVIDRDYADLVENARRQVRGLVFASDRMRSEMIRRLPFIQADLESKAGEQIVIMNKRKDEYLLTDILAVHGKIDPVHVAWIMNAVYDIVCYLEWSRTAHLSISPDSIFLSPARHSADLLGGWWYSRPDGARINAMSRRAYAMASPHMISDKRAITGFDLIMVKALGRELLGDLSGMRFDKSVPAPMVSFLKGPSSGSAVTDYRTWKDEVLPACFGARRFVEMKINPSAILKR